jgi:hypothetical protein
MISGAALVGVIWIATATIAIPTFTGDRKARSSVRTEIIALMCLSGQEAGKLIDPYFQSKYSSYYFSTGENPAITMRGTPDELAKARDLIRAFEQDRDVDSRLGHVVCRSGPTKRQDPSLLDPSGGATLPKSRRQTTPPKK